MSMAPITIFSDVRLTRDPEVKYVAGGMAVCNASVAYNERYTGRDGKQVDRVHFYDLTFWKTRAEYLCKYGHKGAMITANCTPIIETWTTQTGDKRTKTMFRVNTFSFVKTNNVEKTAALNVETDVTEIPPDPDDQDIPF